MTDTPTPAEIIAAHDYIDGLSSCSCGKWEWTEERNHFCGEDARIAKAHHAHVIAALSEHYHLLPKAEPTDTWNHETDMSVCGWEVGDGPYFVEYIPREVELEHDGRRLTSMKPVVARELASALASAADVAEGKS